MRRKVLAVATAALLVSTPAAWAVADTVNDNDSARGGAPGLRVPIRNVDGDRIGTVRLLQRGPVVWVRANVRSLAEGFHGFHVHQTGLCDPNATDGPFTSAGGHYTGGTNAHGGHAGDMPSLLVRNNGTGTLSFLTDRFTLRELRSGDGSAVMVHGGPDNFANIPTRYSAAGTPGPDATTLATGDAGDRVACGVVD